MSAVRSGEMEMLQNRLQRVTGVLEDYDPLLELIGDAKFVLLGEASHGTHEFYRERAQITKRLINEKHFNAVAVEADWPDAYRVNNYVRGRGPDATAEEALAGFKRFPTWMWRNAEVLDFVGWLRAHNDGLPGSPQTGFYGLDLYSLHTSMHAVVAYLDKVDPQAASAARSRYACFDRYGEDTQSYGWFAGLGSHTSCAEDVTAQLLDLQRRAGEYAQRDGRVAADEFFYAEQNARLAKNAEAYYRAMFKEETSSWNLRDRHMAEMLTELSKHIESTGEESKIVLWAHNSHLGDARATQMGDRGDLNIGQLVREEHGHDTVLVGFTTHSGTVTAASDWGGPAKRRFVRPALPGSYEQLFHECKVPRFMLNLRDDTELAEQLREPLLERAIGVIYLPETERHSHYFEAHLPDQFDAVFHFDETRAVEPLETSAPWHEDEEPETYPTGL